MRLLAASVAIALTLTACSSSDSSTTPPPPPVASVGIVPDSIVLPIGATSQLSAVTKGADSTVLTGRTIAWSSLASAIATVGSTGLVTAVTPGSATVTATSESKIGNAQVFVATPRLVFLWNNISAPVGTQAPSILYSYSSGSGTNTVSATGTGAYGVHYSNFARSGAETETVYVTAYGGASTFCTVGGWSAASASTFCFDATGNPVNNDFNFLVVGSATFGGRFAYAWANTQTPSGPYQPNGFYRFSSSNQPITVTHTGTGVYSVLFAGQGRVQSTDREALMVSAYGGTNFTCQAGGWASSGADLTATVNCFDNGGGAADTKFDVALVSQPRAGATLGIVDADQPSNTSPYTPTNSKVLPTGAVTVTRNGAGSYSVRFDGLIRSGALKETFQITAVGSAMIRCQSAGWSFDGTGVTSDVLCTDLAGAPTDSRFTMVGAQ